MVPSVTSGAVVAAQRKKIVRQFISTGATSYKESRTLKELGLRNSLIFKKLIRQGIIVEATFDRYFIDLEKYEEEERERRRLVTILLVLIALGFVVALVYRVLG